MLEDYCVFALVLLVEYAMLQIVARAVSNLYLSCHRYMVFLYELLKVESLCAVVVVSARSRVIFLWVKVGNALEIVYVIDFNLVWYIKKTALALRSCRVIVRPLAGIASHKAAYPRGIEHRHINVHIFITEYHTQRIKETLYKVCVLLVVHKRTPYVQMYA